MATSPIYNWPEPDNTDLVKNGALAIRTLGDAIDTTMATMVPKSIVDAKGDLIGATANDTPARLAVGTNGQVLTADSTAATGLAWATPVSGYADNGVLNSAFQVWQRGTSISTASAGYTADRWYTQTAANGTVSRQATGDTTNLPNIQYCARVQRTAAATTVTDYALSQSFESINSIPFAGKTVTFSFYARRGANFSGASNVLNVALVSGTGTDQNYVTGYTGQATPVNSTATLTTTWQRFTYTGSVAATATELAVNFYYTSSGTAGAADYYEITGVMVEVGSTASAFHTNQPNIQAELAACQRYYWRSTSTSSNSIGMVAYAKATATTAGWVQFPLPITMRVSPTLLENLNMQLTDISTNYSITSLSLQASSSSPSTGVASFGGATGLINGDFYFFRSSTTGDYIAFGAEL